MFGRAVYLLAVCLFSVVVASGDVEMETFTNTRVFQTIASTSPFLVPVTTVVVWSRVKADPIDDDDADPTPTDPPHASS
ncbi:hypothetical protein HGRIS_013940 [Hohenbuehelia grisea]|uniref:Uncharacterized protein n=1 Tax=Hohenbuehelia grisea TaxID=104357 RepID=A0ABR3JSI3_9AGAR